MDDYKTTSRMYDFFLEPFVHHVRKDMVRWIVKNKPKNILDMGCGTGKQLSLLPHDLSFWGIDISVQMLEQSMKSIQEKCLRGDVSTLPFSENLFDLVYTQFALHEKNFNLIKKALNESRRILTKEGKLIIVDFSKPKHNNLITRFFKKGISLIEKHAGDEHYKNYQTWMLNGGIDCIIPDFGWRKVTEFFYYAGTIKMIVFEPDDKYHTLENVKI